MSCYKKFIWNDSNKRMRKSNKIIRKKCKEKKEGKREFCLLVLLDDDVEEQGKGIKGFFDFFTDAFCGDDDIEAPEAEHR